MHILHTSHEGSRPLLTGCLARPRAYSVLGTAHKPLGLGPNPSG